MIALVLAVMLSAPTEVTVHYMPLGTPLELKIEGSKQRVQYFRFSEYKVLLKMDQDLWAAKQQLKLIEDLSSKYDQLIGQKDIIIMTLQDDIKIKDDRITRVEELWHKAEELAVQNAGGPTWPYVVAILGASVGVLGLGAAFSSSWLSK